MKQYDITGMSCAACSARVEKAVNKIEGVTSCSVNLLTNSMGVEGDVPEDVIIQAVEAAGYGASPKAKKRGQISAYEAATSESNPDFKKHKNNGYKKSQPGQVTQQNPLTDKETPLLRKRLIWSLAILIILMYFSMGHMMWGWPVPSFFEGNPMANGLLQLVLSALIMVINQKFFISGFKGLLHKAPNMDTLVAMGATAAFGYSTYALLAMTKGYVNGDMDIVHKFMHEFYFESAGMILTLITLGKMLEARSKGKTTDALKSLMALAPQTATLLRDGEEVVVGIDEVQIGDIFVVRPGENIPVDGIVLEGTSAVNEAALTGESIPVDKEPGCKVSAATMNQSGFIKCQASRVGEDTTLSQIIQMVSDAAATKAPIAKMADKVSGVFVPVVIGIAVVTFVVWMLTRGELGFAIARAISVLVISCPCALGLATPVAIMVGSGMGAKHGILFKNAVSLEETGRSTIVALDKTGTITSGKPVVTDLYPMPGLSKEELMAYAYALECKSEHPLAHAIVEKAKEMGIAQIDVTEFTVLPGNGLEGYISNNQGEKEPIYGGNRKYFQKRWEEILAYAIPEGADKTEPSPWQKDWGRMEAEANHLADQGKTPLFFGKGTTALGVIAVADEMKEDSKAAIAQLKAMGIHVVMLTGDNEITANAIGAEAGVDEVIAGVLPEGKEEVIRRLKESGKVIMVGDGINDAPALTRADIGIAIGAGTDVAIDAAEVVLMKSQLTDVVGAIRLSKATLRNIKQNLFWAFFYNVIGIPLAAGIWIPIFGWELNPMFGALAMSLSSFCVVTNALRLNLFPIYGKKSKIEETINKSEERKEENIIMEKIMNIEGMMCPHCSGRVQKVLEELPQVTKVVASHETKNAIVTYEGELSNEVLTQVVTEAGYQVVSIEG